MAKRAVSSIQPIEPEVVGQVLALPVKEIELGKRLRPIDPVWAHALAALMYRDGQDTPIDACRLPGRNVWTLVTGGHRLTAAQINNWETIKAVVVSPDALVRRRKQVAENLFRGSLNPIDRAAFVAELYGIEKLRAGLTEAQHPRTAGANVRWSKVLKDQSADATAMIAVAYGFTDRVAAQIGLSVRTVRDDLQLHYALPPSIADRLRAHPIAANAAQLRALAKLAPDDQAAAADLILGGKSKSVSDAVAVLRRKATPTPETKAWSAFFGGWSRMSAAKRREALAELAEQGLPKGVRIVFGDAP